LENLDKGDADNLLEAAPQIKKLFPDDPAQADRIISQMLAQPSSCRAISTSGSDRLWIGLARFTVSHANLDGSLLRLGRLRVAVWMRSGCSLQLSSDAEMRMRLLASADALTKEAGGNAGFFD